MKTNEDYEEEEVLNLELYVGGKVLEISIGTQEINLYRAEALKLLAELPGMISQMTE